MRIAIVTQGYLQGGGVATIVSALREGLAQHDHAVDVHDLAASTRDSYSRRVLKPRSWGVSALGPWVSESDPHVRSWGANWVEVESSRYRPRRELTDALRAYDLVQVVSGAAMLGLVARDIACPPVLQIATTIGAERRAQFNGMPWVKSAIKRATLPAIQRLERQGLLVARCVLVENSAMRAWVQSQTEAPVHTVYFGPDGRVFRAPARWCAEGPIAAFGRLAEPRKNWPAAVEAFERYVELTGDRDRRLRFIGRGPVSPQLERRIACSPLRALIDVAVDLEISGVVDALRSASVFLQVSHEEGLGIAGLEAMACGLPVVATNTVGSREYVRSGENGFLIEIGPGMGSAAARALALTLGSGDGPKLAERARLTATRFSAEAALSAVLAIYSQLVDS